MTVFNPNLFRLCYALPDRACAGSFSRHITELIYEYEPHVAADGADFSCPVLRVVAVVLLFEHGTMKILHFPVSDAHPAMFSLLWFGGILEIVGGALIVLGLFTRIAAFVLSGMMAVAYFMFHAPSSLYPANNGGDAAILFCFIFLYLVFAGPGSFSLDGKRK